MPAPIQLPSLSEPKIFGNPIVGGLLDTLTASLGITRQNAGFIVDEKLWDGGVLGNRIDIKYFSMERSEKVSAKYNPIQITGRSSPLHAYSSGGAVNYSFSCYFIAEGNISATTVNSFMSHPSLDFLTKSGPIDDEVMKPVRWLKSLAYPMVKDGIAYPPPSPTFIFGDFLSVKVFVTDVSVTYSTTSELSDLKPIYAQVDINMIQNTNYRSAYSQKEVMQGDDMKVAYEKQINFNTITAGNVPNFLGMLG